MSVVPEGVDLTPYLFVLVHVIIRAVVMTNDDHLGVHSLV